MVNISKDTNRERFRY